MVAPDGEVQGLSVPRLSHIIRHGLGVLDELQAIAADYQGKMGDVGVATRKANRTVQYYNDMAFEMRVQANRFNKFSGLINDQLDVAVAKVETRLKAAGNRAAIMGAQMRMYTRSLERVAQQRDRSLHRMLMAFHQRLMGAMLPLQNLQQSVDAYDDRARAMVREARKKTESIRDIVETLRLISHNPRLKQQFRQMTGDLRTRMHALREMLKSPAGMPSKGGVPPSPAPDPETTPSPVTQPDAAEPVMPAAPGIPVPPDQPSTGRGPHAPRPLKAPVPLPTVQGPSGI